MDVICLKTVSSPGKSSLKDFPIASKYGYLTFPSFSDASEILLWPNVENKDQPRSLCGHDYQIQALCFGNNPDKLLLASACKKSINIWKLHEGLGEDLHYSYVQVGKNLGEVSHLTLSPDDVFIIVCIQDEIWVIQVMTNTLAATFTGHGGDVVAAEFCPVDANLLVSISEDKTFGIWNLTEKCQIYQSSIISASTSFLSLAMNPLEPFFSVGSTDGTLRVFDMTVHNRLHEVNIAAIATQKFFDEEDERASGFSILSLKYWNRSKPIVQDVPSVVSVALNEELYLVAGCTSCFMMLNANSMDILWLVCFSDVSPSNPDCHLSAAARISFSVIEEDEKLMCSLLNLFSNDVHILRVENTEGILSSQVTVLSLEPLAEDSPLKSELERKPKEISKRPTKTKMKVDKMNQSIIFKDKVRSSGYTNDKPRKQMFQPAINSSRPSKQNKKIAATVGPWGSTTTPRPSGTEYPIDSEPPTMIDLEKKLSETETPINDLSFSDTGKSLICAVGDHTALLMKMPKLNNTTAFIGHNGPVITACMGHTNNMLMTSCMDQTVKLWSPGQKEPVLDLSNYKHNFKQDKVSQTTNRDNPSFIKGISGARFYYVDKFILLSHGSSLCLYKYHIDNTKNDVKRYQTFNRYKLVKDYEISDAQNITTFSAINSFYSYIVICACSNRDVVIFDANKGANLSTINDAHKKPIHSLCQNQGSAYVTHTSEAYDLFLTAATSDGVKLWDLRVNRCVRKFDGHVNRAQKVGLAFSPCAKYIAVGSEDRSVFVYDIRSSSHLHRLSGHSDVVTSVAFHPQYPLLACGTQSGKLRTYKI